MLIKLALPGCVNKNNIVDYIPFFVGVYLDCHVTSLLESDWRALYGARRHGLPPTHFLVSLSIVCNIMTLIGGMINISACTESKN